MYKVKVWNRYQIRAMLESENFDPTRFYKDELIQFLAVAMDLLKENKILKSNLPDEVNFESETYEIK